VHYFFFKSVKVNNVATIGYNTVPFKAYIIIAALSALMVATLLTLVDLEKK